MTAEQLRLRDEILQVLYWLKGEDLGSECTAGQFALWTGMDEAALLPVLALMQGDGWLEAGSAPHSYRFTTEGEHEGKRRFADAFADHGLGWSGPGGCGPDCQDCLADGPGSCHAHGAH